MTTADQRVWEIRLPFADDQTIEQLAADQLGLVTRAQLRARGITAHCIASRVQSKRLRVMHRGVYRVGPVLLPQARELAAQLACGPHAVVSHRSAGWIWDLLPDPGDAPVEISLHHGDRGRRPGIHVHRVRLQDEDVTSWKNIRVTTPRRTLVDLAGVLTPHDLERVLARTERLNLLEREEVQLIAARHAGRRGAPVLRRIVESESGPAFTRSEAEERFLALVRKSHLPDPECNELIGEYEVDFYWRAAGVVVEVDGFAFHATKRMFESDRRRDAWLVAQGVSVLRFTWQQITKEPEAVLVRLAQTLARGGAIAPRVWTRPGL